MEVQRAVLQRRQLQFSSRYEQACKIDTAESVSEFFHATECEKCIGNQESWRQKPKWENVSTALQGFLSVNVDDIIKMP